MPLSAKGAEILKNMVKEYGAKGGKRVFYASANAGKITGVHGSGTHKSPFKRPGAKD